MSRRPPATRSSSSTIPTRPASPPPCDISFATEVRSPMFYDLASTTWGQEALDAIQRVLREGRFTMGEYVRRFEDAFASKFGVKHAVMVNSGSSANLVGI